MNAADWAIALADVPGAVKLLAILAALFLVLAVAAWWAGRGPESDVDGTPEDSEDSIRYFRSYGVRWRVEPDGSVQVGANTVGRIWSGSGMTLADLLADPTIMECTDEPGQVPRG